jgi:hypothetical protein
VDTTEQAGHEERDDHDQEDADELREHGSPLLAASLATTREGGPGTVRKTMKLRVEPAETRRAG